MNKKVAVIILNWNGAALLRRYLPSVVSNTNASLADVIVADNGSTDDSRQVLAQEFPMVKTVMLDKNYGFAGGYNKAIGQTRYPVTVLLNSDVRTPAGWLEPLVEHLDAHPECAALQPKLLHDRDDDVQEFEYAGACGGYIDKHGYPYCRGRIFGTVERDHGQYDQPGHTSVMWASGACLAVRSQLYLQLGGLDERFFAHMEEIDLCWRLINAGHQVHAVTASHVYHLGGASLPQGNPRKTYLNFRNNLLLLKKNLPAGEGRRIILVRRLYDTLAWLQSVATGRWADARAILKAHNDYRRMARDYAHGQPAANMLAQRPQGRVNIIVAHYLRRVSRYSQLGLPQ